MTIAAPSTTRTAHTPQNRSRRMIFSKYVIIFVTLVSATLLVSGALEMYFSYRENQRSLLALQREKALSAVTIINDFINDIQRQIGWTVLPRGISGSAILEARREDYFRLQRQVPAITEIHYLDRTGRERIRVSRLRLNLMRSGTDYSRDPAFIRARDQTYVGPVTFRSDSEPYVTVAMADRSSDGGVTVADINLKFIWDVISRMRIGPAGHAFVLDSMGQLVAHSDISLVLKRTNFSTLGQFRMAASLGNEAVTEGGGAMISRDWKGRRVLTAFQRVPLTGWWVFVEQPLGEAFAPIVSSLIRTTMFLAIGLIVAVLVSVFLARKMVTPIRALQEGAARVAAGALDHRIEVRTGDELEALADEFNHMARELKELYSNLEGKVKERTRELAQALEEIEEKSRQLEVASRHKSEFLASMSHELRTPLNAIIGFSDVMMERLFGELNPRQERYIQHILSSARHLLALITDILDLSRVEAGRMTMEVERFSVPVTLEDSLAMVAERARRQNVSIRLHIAREVDCIEADPRKFKQVLFNLLSNAVKFTPDGGGIMVGADIRDSCLRIEIRDTGIGISLHDQARIFEAFEQAGPRSERHREGTGLGLALTKQLVELHGGRIRVQSAPGAGSTFTVELPLSQPAQAVSSGQNGTPSLNQGPAQSS